MNDVTAKTLQPFFELSALLRAHGFAVSPDQTMGFLEAINVLGPRDINDVYQAAIALFSVTPERRPEFDAIFQKVFYGLTVSANAQGADDSVDGYEATGEAQTVEAQQDDAGSGIEASTTERLQSREFTLSLIHI